MLKYISEALNARKSEKGFTLIELLVVVAIIAILAAIAIPAYIGYTTNARHNSVKAEAANAATAIAAAVTKGDTAITTVSSGSKVVGTDDSGASDTIVSSNDYTYSVDPSDASAAATGGTTEAASLNTDTKGVYVSAKNGNGDYAWAGTSDWGTGHVFK